MENFVSKIHSKLVCVSQGDILLPFLNFIISAVHLHPGKWFYVTS